MRQHRLLVLLAFGWLLVGVGCRQSDPDDVQATLAKLAPQVDVVPVVRDRIESSIELTGTLYPWKFATIASEVTGVIDSVPDSNEELQYESDGKVEHKVLPLDIGHAVKKGETLLQIRASEHDLALALAQARTVLAQKELANLFAWKRSEEIAQLKAQCEECDAVLLDANADLTRAKTLVARNAASTKEVEDAQRSVATAQASKKRAEAALELAEAGPTEEQIEVAKAQLALAEAEVASKADMVAKCTITCPLDAAWVVERYVGVGDYVTANPSTPLMRIVDSTILLAQIHVPERYQGLIQVRDMAKVTVQGGFAAKEDAGAVDAMVVLVNAQVDPDTRTFRVRVGIDNSQNLFKPGTFVKVSIPLETYDALVVPVDSVTFSQGNPAAFRVRNGVTDRVPLVLGISDRLRYQVLSGLSEDDIVVKGRLSLMAPNLQVEPRTNSAEAAPVEDQSSSVTPSQG